MHGLVFAAIGLALALYGGYCLFGIRTGHTWKTRAASAALLALGLAMFLPTLWDLRDCLLAGQCAFKGITK